ncbi:EamA family transporter [Candidatus Micrarchaeota archaeon]|nr:EamA family transporter [Candidatus Micrarchaeota archaeon]
MAWFVFAALTAFFNASRNVLCRRVAVKTDRYVASALMMSLGAVIPLALLFFEGVPALTEQVPILLATSLFFESLALIAYFKALELTEVSLALPVIAITPALLLLTSPFLTGEVPSAQGIFGVLLVVAGTYFLGFEKKTKDLLLPFKKILANKGMMLMFAVSLLYVFTATAYKLLVANSSPLFTAASVLAGLGILFWLPVLASRKRRSEAAKSLKDGMLNGVLQGLESITIGFAFATGMTPYVIAIKRMSIPATVLLSHKFLNESDFKKRMLASLVSVAGAVLIVLSG